MWRETFKMGWVLARKDAWHFLRMRVVWFWAFAMPIVFFYFIGTITGGFGGAGGSSSKDRLAAVVPESAGYLAGHVLAQLERCGFSVERVSDQEAQSFSRRLVFPERFTETVLSGEQAKVHFTYGDNEEAQFDEFRIRRALYSALAGLVVAERLGEPPETVLKRLEDGPGTLSLEVRRAGFLQRIPSGFQQAVPGTMVMTTLLVLLITGGVTLFLERRHGILRRLASAPMPRGAVVLGKWGARFVLGAVQIAWAVVLGALVFGVDWGPHWLAVLALLAVYAAFAASAGVLYGNLVRSEGQAIALGVILANLLAALGGCWWPIEITPLWAQRLAMLLPTGWAMDALHQLMSFGAPPAAVLPHIAALGLSAVVAGWLAARSFRFQ